jgi:hypothetical protein
VRALVIEDDEETAEAIATGLNAAFDGAIYCHTR